MIKVLGSACHSFIFPASLPLAYAYYGDVSRVLNYLPHICLVRAYGPDRFRLAYSSTELGAYHIRIFADVQTTLAEGRRIRVHPLPGIPPARSEAGLNSATAQGYFESESIFYADGEQTRIEYSLKLQADLPAPLGLRFVPGGVIGRIARSITKLRIREISAGFIERSVAAFPHWLAEFEDGDPLLDQVNFQPGPVSD